MLFMILTNAVKWQSPNLTIKKLRGKILHKSGCSHCQRTKQRYTLLLCNCCCIHQRLKSNRTDLYFVSINFCPNLRTSNGGHTAKLRTLNDLSNHRELFQEEIPYIILLRCIQTQNKPIPDFEPYTKCLWQSYNKCNPRIQSSNEQGLPRTPNPKHQQRCKR